MKKELFIIYLNYNSIVLKNNNKEDIKITKENEEFIKEHMREHGEKVAANWYIDIFWPVRLNIFITLRYIYENGM